MARLKKEKRTLFIDLAAAAVFCALFGWFLHCLKYGLNRVDESFYLTIAQRFLMGDRPFIDEWHLSQLSALFQMLPLKAFISATGTTDGSILFMRYVFLAVHALLFWYLYIKLRPRRWQGLAATALVFAFIPFAMFTLNYYTMAEHALLIMCAILFLREKPSAPLLIFAGAVYGCAVVIDISLVFIYFIYLPFAAARLIARRKGSKLFFRYDFVLDGRVWGFVSLGIAVVASALLIWLQLRSGIPEILRNLPNLLSDSEYDLSSGGVVSGYLIHKIQRAASLFGILWSAGCAVSFLCGAVYAVFRKKIGGRTGLYLRAGIFSAAVFFALAASIRAILYRESTDVDSAWRYFSVLALPPCGVGAVCYLLCKEKDRRIFSFLLAGAAASFVKDVFSEVSLGIFFVLGYIPAVIFSCRLLRELREEFAEAKTENARKSAGQRIMIAVSGLLSLLLIVQTVGSCLAGSFRIIERWYMYLYVPAAIHEPLDSQIEKGPYRGIYTTSMIKKRQENMLSDLDAIAAESDGPVYVTNRWPAAYLYLGRKYSVYSTWYVAADEARQEEYWRQFPERVPDHIYVPFYHGSLYISADLTQGENRVSDSIAWARAHGSGEPVKGAAGYIVRCRK